MSKYIKRWGFLMVLGACSLYGQWEADVRITDSTWVDYGSKNFAWTIAAEDSFVHIVWECRDGSNPGRLSHVRSTDYGTTFEPAQEILPASAKSAHFLSIGIWDNYVHIAYYDLDATGGPVKVSYTRSTDYGVSWEPAVSLSPWLPGVSTMPSLAVWDNVVHVVWHNTETGADEIYYRRSTDYGVNWEPEVRFTYANVLSRFPSVAVWDNVVHVVWGDCRDNDWGEIYYKRSTDCGASWEPDFRLTYTNDNQDTWNPTIAVWDNIVHVVWRDRRNASLSEVYYKRSTDYGVNWESDFRLTYDGVDAWGHNPNIAVYDSAVHIVWNSYPEYEIHYIGSDNDGVSWGGNVRLTYAAGFSCWPSVAATPCDYDVHVAWTDQRDGNDEIYYKRHKCGATSVEEEMLNQVQHDNLLEVFPNPSTGKTVIRYLLSENRNGYTINDLRLTIHDISGRLVKTLYSGTQEKGEHNVWQNELSTGIYFVRLEAEKFKTTKKLTILR